MSNCISPTTRPAATADVPACRGSGHPSPRNSRTHPHFARSRGRFRGAPASWTTPLFSRFGTAEALRRTDHAEPATRPLRKSQRTGALQNLAAGACSLLLLLLLPARGPAATRTVTSLADDGGSETLRSRIAQSAPGDTIDFAVSGTITLTSRELVVEQNLVINGPGADLLAVSGNHSSRAFVINGGTVTISGLTIRHGSSGIGGGILNGDRGVLVLAGCRVQGNQAGGDFDNPGGGIYSEGILTLSNSCFDGNSAEYGGAVYIARHGGRAALWNCTFSANTASALGGGIMVVDDVPCDLVNCTLAENQAGSAGGGMSVYLSAGVTLLNTIVARNNSGSSGDDVDGTVSSRGHNFIGDGGWNPGWVATDLVGSFLSRRDPQLGPLQDNGGHTPTMALGAASAAIDAGYDAVLEPPHNLITDQRGLPRLAGDHVDIGAYEFGSEVGAVTRLVTTLNDGGGGSLRQILSIANPFDRIIFAPVVRGKIRLTSGELFINKPLSIIGPGTAALAISGNTNSRVFHIGPQGNVDIYNLTITEGRVVGTNGGDSPGWPAPGGAGQMASGGGILNEGSLLVSDCMITSNSVVGGSGGRGRDATPQGLSGVRPPTQGGAGGIAAGAGIGSSAIVTVLRSTFLGNFAAGGSGGVGGGSTYPSHPGGVGGTGGSAVGSGVYGGTQIQLTSCTLAGNHAVGGSGGDGGTATQNVNGPGGAGGEAAGGAISDVSILVSCTMCANAAVGGLGGAGSTVGNSGQAAGGVRASALSAVSTIIAGNTGSPTSPDVAGSVTSLGWNLIGITDGSSGWTTNDFLGNSTFPLNALLGPCQDNGGPVWTMCPLGGSPARDNGNSDLPTDARGGRRIVNFPSVPDAPGGNGSDIGALEVDSLLRIVSLNKAGNVAAARFKSDAGNNYVLQQTSVITNRTWTNVVGTGRMGDGQHLDVADPAANPPHRFFRIRSDPTPILPEAFLNGPGNALDFDGEDDYVVVAPMAILAGDLRYTVEAWIKPVSMDAGGIVAWGNYTNSQVNALAIHQAGFVNYWWANDLSAPTPNLVGSWHHVAATFDGTTRRIFLNGNEVASDIPAQPPNFGTADLRIGLANVGQYFDGQIDEVRIWSAGRSQAQIREAMRRRLQGNEANLVAYWRFDEGSDLLALDSTGNASHTGVLRNGPAWVVSTILPFAPNAATLAATAVTGTSATLNGSANPNGAATMGYFEWGATVNLGNLTPAQSLGGGTAPVTWNRMLTGLTPGARYYRAVATNSHGASLGEVLSFW